MGGEWEGLPKAKPGLPPRAPRNSVQSAPMEDDDKRLEVDIVVDPISMESLEVPPNEVREMISFQEENKLKSFHEKAHTEILEIEISKRRSSIESQKELIRQERLVASHMVGSITEINTCTGLKVG